MGDFVSINGARVEYEWRGPMPSYAPTLVFLHEGLGSLSLWRDFPSEVCSRVGCGALIYSRFGHGKSEAITGPRSVNFMHEEATAVLPRLLEMFEIRWPILVGHSDGASIALIYAGAVGDPFALILEAPHVFVEDMTIRRITELRDLYRRTDLRTRLARHHQNVDSLFESWTGVWLRPEFRSWNIEPLLPSVSCPTLVLQGRQDEYGTEAQVNAVTEALGGRCEGIMLDACGHAPHVDQRATVSALMARFIRGLE